MAVKVADALTGSSHSVPYHSNRADLIRKRGIRIPPKASKVIIQTRAALSKHVKGIAKKADEHEHFINKVTYCIGVLCFGLFCYILGSRPYDIPRMYALIFCIAAPLRWAYYKSKKWHYYLLDFCYYANAILVAYLVFFPTNEKLFLLCFAFSEGPLAWALFVWRCSLVFSSVDKIVSVLIHLLPGTVLFIVRWWDPVTFPTHSAEDTGPFPPWPLVTSTPFLCTWLILVPLIVYSIWQAIYYLVVEVLRRQRFVRDPEVMTSFRELSRKSAKVNSPWWRLSGVFGDAHRVHMFCLYQALFTVITIALTVPMFRSYRLHAIFQFFKVAASIWHGGNFFFDVMPRQVQAKADKKRAARVAPTPDEDPTHPPDQTWSPKVGGEGLDQPTSLANEVSKSPKAGGTEETSKKSSRPVTPRKTLQSGGGAGFGKGAGEGVKASKSQEGSLRGLLERGERELERERKEGEGDREKLEVPRANSSDESDEEDVWEEVWEEVEAES